MKDMIKPTLYCAGFWIAVAAIAALLTGCGKIEAPYNDHGGGPVQKDDTDPPNGRSGLTLYTDNLTGCQYLAIHYNSGLTPRMGKDGKQVCQ